MQGGVHAGVGLVPAAFLEGREQFAVRGESVIVRVGEPCLRLPQPPLDSAKFAERGIDDVLDGVSGAEPEGPVQGLGQIPGAAGGADGDLAGVGRLAAGDQPQQRRLPRAVLTDDTGALTGPHGQRHLIEDRTALVRLRDVLHGQLGAFAHVLSLGTAGPRTAYGRTTAPADTPGRDRGSVGRAERGTSAESYDSHAASAPGIRERSSADGNPCDPVCHVHRPERSGPEQTRSPTITP